MSGLLLRRVLLGVGLAVTGLLTSNLDLHSSLYPLQTYHSELFYTNCLLLLTPDFALEALTVPPQCATIEWLLPAALLASAAVVLLAGFTTSGCLLTLANLIFYIALYCNPAHDSAFPVYAHALQLTAVALGLLHTWRQQRDSQASKAGPYGRP